MIVVRPTLPQKARRVGHPKFDRLYSGRKGRPPAVPITPGNMHFGEHNPFSGLGAAWEHSKEQQ